MDKFEASSELQKKLQDAQEAYEGDLSDRADAIEATILPLAKEVGLPFTYAELQEYEKANGFNPDGTGSEEVSDEELGQVAGGASAASGLLGKIDLVICGCAMYGTSPGGRPTLPTNNGRRW